MKEGIVKTLRMVLVPLGLLLVSILLWPRSQADPTLATVVQYGPFTVFVVAMALGWWFNQSRIFFISLVALVSYVFLFAYGFGDLKTDSVSSAVYNIVSLLLPLNILLFALLRERGVLTSGGKAAIGLVLAQVFLISALFWSNEWQSLADLSIGVLRVGADNWTPLPEWSLVAFGGTLVILLARAVLNNSFVTSCLFAASLAAIVGLHFADRVSSAFYFTIFGLLLVVAVLQRAYTLIYMDELTGIPTRRALREATMRLGSNYTIAMVDIDHFKQFNDQYGHDVGDQALKYIATTLAQVSGGGRAFRHGGEEFIILFPGQKLDESAVHLERLREVIAKGGFILRGKDRPEKKLEQGPTAKGSRNKVRITVSIGIAEKSNKHHGASEVIKSADQALYRAKKKGRNCVSR
ncbi:MAG: GGDEF domain-containing protein [Clostridia bacterium]|nr:GGDEF domain-containing protein [Clostridia bacterium]